MYRLDNEFGFIAHPRCASRSTRDLLMDVYGATSESGHHQIEDSLCRNILRRGGVLGCTVRNIFDVIVSWYFNAHYNEKGQVLNPSIVVPKFDHFVRKQLIEDPRHRWFMTPMYFYALPWCKVQFRYERLDEDVNNFLVSIGREPVPMSHVGKSSGRDPDYRVYFDSSLRRAVEDRWGTDLHLTGYEF